MTTEDIWDVKPQSVEEKKEEPPQEEQKNLGELMFNLPNSPDQAQVEEWKQEHGEVYCSGMSPSEMFVFRSLTRGEFVQVQTVMQSQENQMTQLQLEEQIVKRCLLWTSEEGKKALEKKAGTLSTLHEQILQNSNFVNPAMASALVVKL